MAFRVDLFCEDSAHEDFSRALIGRIAGEESVEVSVRVATARFGVGRLRRELRAFARAIHTSAGLPDLLVVLVDANMVGVTARRQEIADLADLDSVPHVVVGVPDPCVERWFLADRQAFESRYAAVDLPGAGAPGGDWKRALTDALERAGETLTEGGAEFAEEIVLDISLYRAGRTERSLKMFVDDVRAALRQLA